MVLFRRFSIGLTIHLVKNKRMTYMRSWKSHRLTSHTWLGLNPQIGRPLSRIVGAVGLFFGLYAKIKTFHSTVVRFVAHFRHGLSASVQDHLIPRILNSLGVECILRPRVVSFYGFTVKFRLD
jgi:hypothetical protein